MTDIPVFIRPFDDHGVDLDYSNRKHPKQAVGSCPLCGKEDHFYVGKSNGLWDCKSCGESGNTVQFLQKFYELAVKATTDQDYQDLSEERGIPVDFLKRDGYAVNPINGRWLVPQRNEKGTLCNLSRWLDQGLSNTTGQKPHPFGIEELTKRKQKPKRVYIVEGSVARATHFIGTDIA